MKTVKNILFTIAMLGIIFIVYTNVDEISTYVKNTLVSNNEPIINESNDYKRDYQYLSFSYDENYIPLNIEDIKNIYFNILNNGWDRFTFYCPYEYTTCLEDVETVAFDNELLSKINNYVHPYNSFSNMNTKVASNGEISIVVTHKYTEEKMVEINNKVTSILSELQLGGLSEKDKISEIHNYIINNAKYDNEAISGESAFDSNSAYGNLIEGYSVCSGYSDAMAIFLDILKIPNLKVSSKNHIWNLVYVDGEWLHLDLTWDDTDNQKYSNNFFLITKEKLFKLDNKEHSFDETFFLEAV